MATATPSSPIPLTSDTPSLLCTAEALHRPRAPKVLWLVRWVENEALRPGQPRLGSRAFHTMVMIFADREPVPVDVPPQGGQVELRHRCHQRLQPPAASWEWVGGFENSTVAKWGSDCAVTSLQLDLCKHCSSPAA